MRIASSLRFVLIAVTPVCVLAIANSLRGTPPHDVPPAIPQKATTDTPAVGQLVARSLISVNDRIHDPRDLAGSWPHLGLIDRGRRDSAFLFNLESGELLDLAPSIRRAATGVRYESIQFTADHQEICLCSTTDRALLELSRPAPPSLQSPARTVSLERGTMFVLRNASNRYVWAGLFSVGLLRLGQTKQGLLAADTVTGQSLFPEVQAEFVSRELNRSTITSDPSGQRIAQAFLHSSRLNIYSLDGRLQRSVAGPVDIRVEYRVLFDQASRIDKYVVGPDTRLAYVDIASDEDLIYAVFAGRQFGAFRDLYLTGRQIHVFTWNGRFVGNWTLDADVDLITVVRDRLYAVRRVVGSWQLGEYDLAPVFAVARRE